jgi:[pyruvate, water dikinase]-phosphate phosphotransferase / [pyruvate, water dikinase] kinase
MQSPSVSPIYIVSGGKGLAGNAVVQSVLIQFPDNKIPVEIVPDINTKEKAEEITLKVLQNGGILVHTMVVPKMRKALVNACIKHGVKHFDLVGDLSDYLSSVLNKQPVSVPGLYRLSHIDYFARIESIEYTLSHDDGLQSDRLSKADIVLAGVSRSGKTPLSIYLAMYGWKVANIPIVKGIDPPAELFKVDPRRVFGLTIAINYLIAQRENRVKRLKLAEDSDYINPRAVREELDYAEYIFRKGGFTMLDITNKPIESSANDILGLLTSIFDKDSWKKFAGD